MLFETPIPGFGLEAAMNVVQGGSYHFGFFAQADVAEFLGPGQEETFPRHFFDGRSRTRRR